MPRSLRATTWREIDWSAMGLVLDPPPQRYRLINAGALTHKGLPNRLSAFVLLLGLEEQHLGHPKMENDVSLTILVLAFERAPQWDGWLSGIDKWSAHALTLPENRSTKTGPLRGGT